MIVRISGDRQYHVDDMVLDRINEIDDDLEVAVRAGDEAGSSRELARLLALIRDAGQPLAADNLLPSDLILPPDDISLPELAGELSTDGLIPG